MTVNVERLRSTQLKILSWVLSLTKKFVIIGNLVFSVIKVAVGWVTHASAACWVGSSGPDSGSQFASSVHAVDTRLGSASTTKMIGRNRVINF